MCLISYIALHDFASLDYLFRNLRGARVEQHGLRLFVTTGVMLAFDPASISGMPMPAPGLTRWVTSATHLLACVWEATWSHSHLVLWFGVELSAGSQVAGESTSISFLFSVFLEGS